MTRLSADKIASPLLTVIVALVNASPYLALF